MNQLSTVECPRRQEYSAEFKTSVQEQCRQSGASIAGIALCHGINPNMAYRWMQEDRQRLELIENCKGEPRHLCRCSLSGWATQP